MYKPFGEALMKNIRLIAIFILLAIITSTFTACPIVPHRFKWDIASMICDVTYINGNTLTSEIRQGVDYFRLVGIHNEITYIEFFEDGTLVFKPLNADETNGTYKCKNNGIQNTTIFITLENGDKIEALGMGGYFDDTLEFEYNNVEYEFSSELSSYDVCADQEEFNEQLREATEQLRYFEENPQHSDFKPCTIALDENGGAKLVGEDGEIDLYAENLGVVAIRITDNNEVIYLDAIEEGECYFYSGLALNYHTEEMPLFINLYYLDPLPKKEEEENPKASTIFDIFPELSGYYDEGAKNNVTIKMSRELVNQKLGYSNYYNIITNQDDIDNILSTLMWMLLWNYGPPSEDDLNNTYSIDSITLSDNTGKLPEITISSYYDRIKVGDTWYYHNAYEFPNFIYLGAFMKFACYDYNAEIYKNDELLGRTSILEDIEYIIDPNQDYTYSASHDTRTLVTEFGKITVYDATHFWYKGQFYLVTGETTFEEIYQ